MDMEKLDMEKLLDGVRNAPPQIQTLIKRLVVDNMRLYACAHTHRHGDDAMLVMAHESLEDHELSQALAFSDPDTYEFGDRSDEYLEMSTSLTMPVIGLADVQHIRDLNGLKAGSLVSVNLDGALTEGTIAVRSEPDPAFPREIDRTNRMPITPQTRLVFKDREGAEHDIRAMDVLKVQPAPPVRAAVVSQGPGMG